MRKPKVPHIPGRHNRIRKRSRLNLNRKSKPISQFEKFTLVIQTLGLCSISFLVVQTNLAQDSLKASAEIAVLSKVLTLNQIFIENPELYPYFHKSLSIVLDSTNQKIYFKAVATSDYMIDLFDLFYSQADKMTSEDSWEAWKKWIKYSFDNSPILTETYADSVSKEFYTDDFHKMIKSLW